MSTTSKPSSTAPTDEKNSSSPTQRKEVDYYLNPTELFRWINYRRWDGARARILSHPDECETWIVSRHTSDGRILWRHLPLHLVCMQSESNAAESTQGVAPTSQTNRQIEELVDVLLEAYPEGASSPDDQGMLPLHLTVANSTQPNERLINLLLMAYPTAVDVKDKYGRTPEDLLKSKAEVGTHRDAALRAMSRAKHTTSRLVEALRDENTSIVTSVQQSASNERSASQRIIMRLEEELAETRSQIEALENKSDNKEASEHELADKIESLEMKLSSEQGNIQSLRRERDELINQTEILHNQVEEHQNSAGQIQQTFVDERQDQSDAIANLRSETSTAKAMAEALESQLRSRFTNEEYLTNTVSELETELSDLKNKYQQEKKKIMLECDTYENENTQLNRSFDDLKKKHVLLQTKFSELNKQMTTILSSHGALSAEHDRVLEANVRMETDLVDNIQHERSNSLSSMQKQWEFFESAMREQQQLVEDFQKKEDDLMEFAKEERSRSMEVISKMREDFREARTSAAERQRLLLVDPTATMASRSVSGRSKSKNSVGSTASYISSRHSASGSVSSSKSTHRMKARAQEPASTTSVSAPKEQQRDANLLNFLEARNGSRSRNDSCNASSTFVSSQASEASTGSALTSSLKRSPIGGLSSHHKPRVVNFSQDASVLSSPAKSSSSRASNASRASHRSEDRGIMGCPSPNSRTSRVDLDEYSMASSSSAGSGMDSGSEISSRIGMSRKGLASNASQFSGMAAGLRMGMIRIAEERTDGDSQYSRRSEQESSYYKSSGGRE